MPQPRQRSRLLEAAEQRKVDRLRLHCKQLTTIAEVARIDASQARTETVLKRKSR